MSEDSELIMDILRTERGWTMCALDDESSFDDAEDRIYLARLNAEIARRCSLWSRVEQLRKEQAAFGIYHTADTTFVRMSTAGWIE
jgi:hypothetical protein